MNSEINSLIMKSSVLTLKLEEIKQHREAYRRRVMLLFVFMLLIFFSTRSFGQCEMKFEYEVENCTPGKSDGKIYLRLTSGQGNFKVKLYNLPQSKFVAEKSLSFQKDTKVVAFENLQPSAFTIYVFNPSCEDPINIGDKFGIIVSRQ
jgi:hypothetical protein